MRRNVGLVFVIGALLPLALSASAWAQGSTMQLSPQVVSPGDVVKATADRFSTAAGSSPVSIRLSTRDGQELASAAPDSRNLIDVDFRIPAGTPPGSYLVLATQTTEVNGRQRGATPSRAEIRIRAAGGSGATPPAGGPTGWGPPVTPLTVGLALILLAAGSTLTARRLRTAGATRLSR